MRFSDFGKVVFVFSALLLSISVFGQGGGGGGGDGRGRSQQHKGNTAQKTKYRNVQAIQIFAAGGTELYNSAKKPGKSKDPLPVIERVETNQYGVRIFFVSTEPVQKVIDVKCNQCIILIDYKKAIESAVE